MTTDDGFALTFNEAAKPILSNDPRPLTKELMRKRFKIYYGKDLLEGDDPIEEIIDIASGGNIEPARLFQLRSLILHQKVWIPMTALRSTR